jgi:hypothetical protein
VPPSPEQIADIILNRRPVYDLDTDSHIRQMANLLSAHALIELLAREDDQAPDFGSRIAEMLREFPEEGLCYLRFDTGTLPIGEDEPEVAEPVAQSDHYLRLVFRNEEAAYYQFHLFPNLDAGYIAGAARKREGVVQHIHLQLTKPEALQAFIEDCRRNPHFLRVEESTEEEFRRAPSQAV